MTQQPVTPGDWLEVGRRMLPGIQESLSSFVNYGEPLTPGQLGGLQQEIWDKCTPPDAFWRDPVEWCRAYGEERKKQQDVFVAQELPRLDQLRRVYCRALMCGYDHGPLIDSTLSEHRRIVQLGKFLDFHHAVEGRMRFDGIKCCVCVRTITAAVPMHPHWRGVAQLWFVCMKCDKCREIQTQRRERYLTAVRMMMLSSYIRRQGALKCVPTELRLMIWAHLEEALFALPDYSPTWLSDVARLYE
jgi:hypothetical protein